jgi:DNA-binding NarL/FixJ family response regulator
MIDDSNREILMYLSKGNKIKDIERSTSLSMSTIQRRIAHMKDAFNVAEDSTLVKEAILQGFL